MRRIVLIHVVAVSLAATAFAQPGPQAPDREVTIVVSGERFRIEFEQEIWVYDGGVATDGAVR